MAFIDKPKLLHDANANADGTFSLGSIPFSDAGGTFREDTQFTFQTGTEPLLTIWNPSIGGAFNANQRLITEATGGDPRFIYSVNGVTDWSVGIDNSDSDSFKIGNNISIGTDTQFRIDTTGDVYLSKYTSSNVPFFGNNGLIEEEDQFKYFLGSSPSLRLYATTTGGQFNASLQLVTEPTGGDPRTLYTVNGVSDWSVGIDNSDSDIFKIGASSFVGVNTYFRLTTGGDAQIGSNFYFDDSEPQLRIGSSIGTFDGISIGQAANSDIRIGQSSTNYINCGWVYNVIDTAAYAVLDTYNGNNHLLIQSSGGYTTFNGTTAPTAPVTIYAEASSTDPDVNGLYVYQSGTTAADRAILSARVAGSASGDAFLSLDVNGAAGYSFGIDNSDSDKLKLANSWNSLATNTRLTMTTVGDFGFAGETSPTEVITLGGSSETVFLKGSGNIYVNNNTTSSTYFRFHQNSAVPVSVLDSSSAVWFRFGSGAATNTVQMSASGMTMFSATLDANHVFQIPNNIAYQAKAYAFNNYSDERIKNKIGLLGNVSNILSQIEIWNYTFKEFWSDPDTFVPESAELVGCMAQQIYPLLPSICTVDEEGIPNGMDYGRLSPFLVKGWQEHNDVINSLQSRIDSLEQQVAILSG